MTDCSTGRTRCPGSSVPSSSPKRTHERTALRDPDHAPATRPRPTR
jgi:hypothetical protein